MLDVKLIALDLDDTLLNNDRQISDENVKALRECAQRGIYIVMCSGRAEDAILPFVRRLEIAGMEAGRYLIAINGCSIFDLHLRKQIFKTVKSNGSVTTYEVVPTVTQDYENQTSSMYKMAQASSYKAEKTGNMVSLHYSETGFSMDVLLNLDGQ